MALVQIGLHWSWILRLFADAVLFPSMWLVQFQFIYPYLELGLLDRYSTDLFSLLTPNRSFICRMFGIFLAMTVFELQNFNVFH